MTQFGISRIGLDAAGDDVEQVLLHTFKPQADPERADVALDAGVLTASSAVAALIAAGHPVFVLNEVAPHLNDEADPVGVDQQGKLASFDRFGRPSAALRALPRLDLY